MRVLFLTLYPDTMASPRYRVHQFLPYLRDHGVDCTVQSPFSSAEFDRLRAAAGVRRAAGYHLHEFRRRLGQVWAARDHDVVVVQKAVMSAYVRLMGRYVRRCARRVVYDIDDAVHLAPPHPLPRRWRPIEERGQIRALFAQADRVLAGNRWLAETAEAEGGRATLFPTVVDTDRFVPSSAGEERYVVGWMGSPSTTENLHVAADVFQDLSGGEVALVGADPAQIAISNATVRPWSIETEVAEIQRFSVGLMPLKKSEWSRGKCALKALQYMACGIPCVATPFGAILDIIDDGVNGLFADTADEWASAVERLRDPAFRARLGAAGRETIVKRYSLKAAAPRLLDLLESVAS